MKIRGFEKVAKYADIDFPMPERKTELSAGYDFCLPEEVTLEPGKLQLVPTGVKAYMQAGEWLGMHIRSSMAVKKRLMLVNNVGIIDADYYITPIPAGLVLTGIVVSVSVTAFSLALVLRLYKHYGSLDMDEILRMMREEEGE